MFRFLIIAIAFLFIGCRNYYKVPQVKNSGKFKTFTKKDTLIGSLSEFRSCYDVTFYDLDLKFNAPKRYVEGQVDIYFTVIEPTSIIQIDLAKKMDVLGIYSNDQELPNYIREESAIFISFPEQLNASTEHSITILYEGKPQIAKKPPWRGGFVCKRVKGKPYMGVACEDDGAHIWWPLKDHISDKPDSCQMSYTVKRGLTAVGNGRLISKEEIGENTKFTWRTYYPINTYNITFYVGDYVNFSEEYQGDFEGFKLDYYVLPHNLEKAKNQFQQVDRILKVYEKYFGPYPWPKDGYKLVESPYEGMEHQTAIAYGSAYKTKKWEKYDYIILHETAHEWWGNAVTNCDMADLWIHEGFATYAEMLYEEEVFGKADYEWSYIWNRRYSKYKRPLVGPKDVAYTNFKDNDIYSKGAAVLAALRLELDNDEIFFDIIYSFSMENRNACVRTSDFIDLVNEKAEGEYQWFFDQYIYRREAPELLYYYETIGGGKDEFYFKWNKKNTNDNFNLTVHLLVGNKEVNIHPTMELQKMTFKTSEPVEFDTYDYVTFTSDEKIK